jgi:dihydroorotate dehydrogenase electron transfer subunit
VIQQSVFVDSNQEIAEGLFLLKFNSQEIASAARPGQFLNIRVPREWDPLLLRRPFSISRVVGKSVELLFNPVGKGTRILSQQRPGDELDVLGPLGVPFHSEDGFETSVIVAGGLGVAPFPFLTDELERRKQKVLTFVGSRSAFDIGRLHLNNVLRATDDGSRGFKGNVVECLADYLNSHKVERLKIYGCGPTRMLSALSEYAQAHQLTCEVSLEGDMACGIGICQGCPVEKKQGTKKYALVCTDGPTFDCRDIILPSL